MPLKRIICPHCEQPVEVSMTSVTRSRECPLCGRTIMLQFTTQEKRQRRKALLMPTVDTGKAEQEAADLSAMPMPIQGDLRERMLADPEVRQRVKIIKISVAVIVLTTALVVLGGMFHWWSGLADTVSSTVRQYQASRSLDDGTRLEASKPQGSGKITFPNSGNTPSDEDTAKQDQAAALKAATSFLKAANVDERLGFVLNRKTAEPRMREYYKHHPDGPYPYETMENLGLESGMKDTYAFAVIQKSGARHRLMVRKSVNKGFLADWPSFVIYSEMEWSDFLRDKPQKPVLFRVFAKSANVYRNDFIDPDKLVCLQLNNPLDEQSPPIYAYALRSSSLGRTLDFIVRQAGGTTLALTLRLKFPESGGGEDQVWVASFVESGWMTQAW